MRFLRNMGWIHSRIFGWNKKRGNEFRFVKRSDFYYALPDNLIAQHPAPERDGSRLMVLDRGRQTIGHRTFRELPEFLRCGDCLVLNETRVFPARLKGYRVGTGGAVELLLLRPYGDCWEVMARPGRRLRAGVKIGFDGFDLVAVIEEVLDSGHRRIRFVGDEALDDLLATQGHIPLPPYIRREDSAEDRERYQTVYAQVSGSVAAPTAGLHFTPELLNGIEDMGVSIARVLLHVGPGTFKPVTAEDIRDHEMDAEFWEVDEDAAETVNRCRENGGCVIAVGTTSVRTLESAAVEKESNWRLKSGSGWTRIFIYPPYDFRLVNGLITNFHLPESTLLMLVSALAGRDFVMRAYAEAVSEKYRFYSYGDAMMI
jgi:S-adenosylmethionine:tRNA ribosyltransferase-isomerase